jgi:molecular chaperone GrpE
MSKNNNKHQHAQHQPAESQTEQTAEDILKDAIKGNDQTAVDDAQTSDDSQNHTTEEKKEKDAKQDTDTAELEKKVADLKDRLLRQMAEFDNYRKHALKEKTELILNGGEKVLKSLLPVLDDLERAQQSMQNSDDVKALRDGVDLVFKKLLSTLEANGLKKIDAMGKDFDTDYHEAIAMIPAQKDEDKGKVVDCVQTGYMLNNKVIRHAKVAVGQ